MKDEEDEIRKEFQSLLDEAGNLFKPGDVEDLKAAFDISWNAQINLKSQSGRSAMIRTLDICRIVLFEIGLGKVSVICTLLYHYVKSNDIRDDFYEKQFGPQVSDILKGLVKANDLYSKSAAIETENFRKLLLTFAQDIRVILIMIADRLQTMRYLQYFDKNDQVKIARETSYLYAPLAHRLGLYNIKSELEDLSLKFTNREIYMDIAKKLNETKRSRDAYIQSFISPLKEKLEKENLKFEIKGRTKTIYSILNKVKKKNTPFEDIYDLFAIRIVLNSKLKKEKSDCWRAYSVVTDMYQPNPKRLRDWLSIPKSNGYESLHTTVMGPGGKWVEVQIRTERMNEIAEKGFAAHWRYKGIKGEKGLDEWLANVRDILENPEKNAVDLMADFKLGLYEKEVFVFTPKGDLKKMPLGATVLDFAFDIHTRVGCTCVGAIVNGKNVPMRYKLKNGDQVNISTSSQQTPKQDWLNIVTTSRAKTKIKQSLKEFFFKEAELGRETMLRRFKNWKITIDDGRFQRLLKQYKYKSTSDFYVAIANGVLDVSDIKDAYLALEQKETTTIAEKQELKTAENFNVLHEFPDTDDDILTIDQNLKNVDFALSKCCSPIYGDDIFGFVTINGGIKIHRRDCPNAPQMIRRFGYRIVPAQWAGKAGSQYQISLKVTGNDDIGIVSNISQLISQDLKLKMRSISINSKDGVFEGNISLFVSDLKSLNMIIKKIKGVRGVHNVDRLDGH